MKNLSLVDIETTINSLLIFADNERGWDITDEISSLWKWTGLSEMSRADFLENVLKKTTVTGTEYLAIETALVAKGRREAIIFQAEMSRDIEKMGSIVKALSPEALDIIESFEKLDKIWKF